MKKPNNSRVRKSADAAGPLEMETAVRPSPSVSVESGETPNPAGQSQPQVLIDQLMHEFYWAVPVSALDKLNRKN